MAAQRLCRYWLHRRRAGRIGNLPGGYVYDCLMVSLILLLWLVVALLVPAQSVRIIDGDTLDIAHTRYRLFGIDAPESRQTCADGWAGGQHAASYLAKLVRGHTITCEAETYDRYGRIVAICRADGEDLGQAMVRRGMAFAYLHYSWRYPLEGCRAR